MGFLSDLVQSGQLTSLSWLMAAGSLAVILWFSVKFLLFWTHSMPGPSPKPLIGNLGDLNLQNLSESLDRICRKYGSVAQFFIGSRRVVVTADTHLAKTILCRPDLYGVAPTSQCALQSVAKHSLAALEGEEWERHRTLLESVLTDRKNLNDLVPTMSQHTEHLVQALSKEVGKGEAEVDLMPLLHETATEILANVIFGTPSQELFDSIDVLLDTCAQRCFKPVPLYRFFNTPSQQRATAARTAYDHQLARLIGYSQDIERRHQLKRAHSSYNNLALARSELLAAPSVLSLLLKARDKDGKGLNTREIKDELLGLMFMGCDAIASHTAWAMHHLSMHPIIQMELSEEVENTLKGRLPSSHQDLHRLRFVDNVLREALRLSPATGVGARVVKADDHTIYGCPVPRGVHVMISTRTLHTDEKQWADAETFDPDRWNADTGEVEEELVEEEDESEERRAQRHAQEQKRREKEELLRAQALYDSDEEVINRHPFSYLPFGHGPRNCPAQELASMVCKTVLATLVHEFDVDECGAVPVVTKLCTQPAELRVKGEMVCSKCEKKMKRGVIVPDKWKDGARNTTVGKKKKGGRSINPNMLLEKKRKNRFDPLATGAQCKVCKCRLHQKAKYCQKCAYKKGVCAICGKQMMSTKGYVQSTA